MAKTEKSCGELQAEIKDLLQENAELQNKVQDYRQVGQESDELQRLHRALLVRQECSRAIVHAQEGPALLTEICRVIVEIGKYRLAWFGRVEDDGAKTVRPLAQYGFENGYLANLRITWDDTPSGRGPTGTALRTAKPSVARFILTDPAFLNHGEPRPLKGAISLPLPCPSCMRAGLSFFYTVWGRSLYSKDESGHWDTRRRFYLWTPDKQRGEK